MKILFLIYHGFSEVSGISKKIHYQINGLRQLGHQVFVCTYDIKDDGHRVRFIDDKPLQDFGNGRLAAMRKRCCYGAVVKFAVENKIDFVYARSFHNANPFTIRMFKEFKRAGIKSVIEIPTYPYDQEYRGYGKKDQLELAIDKIFRKRLAKQTDAIVTFTQEKEIFGQRTIRISNGIELEAIPLKKAERQVRKESLNFIGVAEVHYWHGFDRLIAGIGEYYNNGGTRSVAFHIIGGIADEDMRGFTGLIEKYGIKDKVVFHGQKFGKELNALFEDADFAVASLGRHRSGITYIKTLKNREYAARGLGFIYSEIDDDFEAKPYILKAAANDAPIDIEQMIDFVDHLTITPEEIRKSIYDLTWERQMERVISEI
ncbi:MAG: glycosyltransferase family 1 protein [Prevotella sp.]|nr:glycosyltransferase family 1 protein [Prevotella sp.]